MTNTAELSVPPRWSPQQDAALGYLGSDDIDVVLDVSYAGRSPGNPRCHLPIMRRVNSSGAGI